MLTWIRNPLSPLQIAIVSVAVAFAVASYCLVYTALAGRPETLAQSFGWAAINVLPWVAPIEVAKRAPHLWQVAAAVGLALLASLALGAGIGGMNEGVGFEIWRRMPMLIAVCLLAIVVRAGARHLERRSLQPLPLLPRQIDWVQAAGNYVELKSAGRTVVHRASLTFLHKQLADDGFVRIHRSTLVRRDRIARVRTEDLVLDDGTHLKIGKRYRAALAA